MILIVIIIIILTIIIIIIIIVIFEVVPNFLNVPFFQISTFFPEFPTTPAFSNVLFFQISWFSGISDYPWFFSNVLFFFSQISWFSGLSGQHYQKPGHYQNRTTDFYPKWALTRISRNQGTKAREAKDLGKKDPGNKVTWPRPLAYRNEGTSNEVCNVLGNKYLLRGIYLHNKTMFAWLSWWWSWRRIWRRGWWRQRPRRRLLPRRRRTRGQRWQRWRPRPWRRK